MTRLGDLAPEGVVVVEATADDWHAPLAPTEEAAVERAVERRRSEFRAGRACAKRALRALGRPTAAIPSGSDRAPIWPEHTVGAITHCDGYCAAAVADFGEGRRQLLGLGIDAEVIQRLQSDVMSLIASEREQLMLAGLPTPGDGRWAAALFSVKESIHKAIYPSTGVRLDFLDVELTIDPAGTAELGFLSPTAESAFGNATFSSRFAVDGPLVFSAAWLSPDRTRSDDSHLG